MEVLGFIGLGTAQEGLNCGYWLAEKLINAGHKVNLYDADQTKVKELAAKGGVACSSSCEVAKKSTIVFIMALFAEDVKEILFGQGGVAEGIKPGSVVIDMSSISPESTRVFAAKLKDLGVDMVDAPVNGGAHRAREERSTLNMLVGADDAVFSRVKPFLDTLGRLIIHVGPCGDGQACKVATQMVNAITIQAICESLVYASKQGCDVAKVREALLARFIDETLLEVHSLRPIEHFFEGFHIWEHQKDIQFALDAARKLGMSLPATALVQEQFNAVVADGGADLDHCALMKVVERNANHKVHHENPGFINGPALAVYGEKNINNLYWLLKESKKK